MSKYTEEEIAELRQDLAELQTFMDSENITRPNNRKCIQSKINCIVEDIKRCEELKRVDEQYSDKKNAEITSYPAAPVKPSSKRYEIELRNYGFDQTEKFVRLYVQLNGIEIIAEENVSVDFTTDSIRLNIKDFQHNDYRFVLNKLLHNIDVTKSHRKIKKDMIVIFCKKVEEGKNWSDLTVIKKRLQAMKDDTFAEEDEEIKNTNDDGSAGLMKMMQKMYQSGDSDMKRMISKAWHEGQQKKAGTEGYNMDMP